MSTHWANLLQLQFLRPWWLLALLLIPMLLWWWRARLRQHNIWRAAVDAHLLPHLLDDGNVATSKPWASVAGVSALALAVLALAGPSLGRSTQPLWQPVAPLVIAVDLSSATLARDLPPTRLAQARAKLAELLRTRAGGQLALVAFADDAYTVAPLTADAANVALFLDALNPSVMPKDGHRLDRAIAWSQRLLKQAGFTHGDILILTDHAKVAGFEAAASAREAGYRVSVLGVGSEQGGAYALQGQLQQARLDATSLRRLAALGGGRYAGIRSEASDLQALGVLKPSTTEAIAASEQAVSGRRDDGYWLLPLVLLLCLPLFRRGSLFALLLVAGLWLPPPPAHAQEAGASTGTLWQRADQVAHAQMQEAIAAYRGKHYAQAIKQFSMSDSADGYYNLGNALARAGRTDEAISAYNKALKLQPKMADAIYNKALLEKQKKQQKKQQQNQQQSQGGGSKKQQHDASKQTGQSGESKQKQDRQAEENTPPQQAGKPAQPQPAQNAQQQAQADAAQHQRMQEALRKQQAQAKQGEKARQAARQETPAQREERLANQAWLRRVPDDPGALLRARFALEAERRGEDGR